MMYNINQSKFHTNRCQNGDVKPNQRRWLLDKCNLLGRQCGGPRGAMTSGTVSNTLRRATVQIIQAVAYRHFDIWQRLMMLHFVDLLSVHDALEVTS
jgi:hypothetical protein